MKRKTLLRSLAFLCVALYLFFSITGVGYRGGSSSVGNDLREDLSLLHGEPYLDRKVERGLETMEFSLKDATFFFSRYRFREHFALDYKYTCTVTYTVKSGDEIASKRKVIYDGYDPIGHGKERLPAYVDAVSKREYIIKG